MATVGDNNTNNANARINILSITAGFKEYICSSQFTGDSVTIFPITRSQLGRGLNLSS